MRKFIKKYGALSLTSILLFGCSSNADKKLLDLSKGSLDGWIIEGEAFTSQAREGSKLELTNLNDSVTSYLIDSYDGGGDMKVGKLISPIFTIDKDYINFYLSGGKHDGLYIALIVDGKTVLKTNPIIEGGQLQLYTWNVQPYRNKKATIEVVDNETGGWGHLLIGEIEMSNTAKSKILSDQKISMKAEKKYILLPKQNNAPELMFHLAKDGKNLTPDFTLRLANTHVDTWMPIDISDYKGQDIDLVFNYVMSDNTGFKQIKQGDELLFDYNEFFRPTYHFSPRYGWMNDPNGMAYFNGVYHLFYQLNPYGTQWGNMHWGHATSKDLKHWKYEPIALIPDSLGEIFSGCMVVDKDNTAGFGKNALIALYTNAGKVQTQSIAYSTDDGKTFTKYEGNPVLVDPNFVDFRDPKVFWYDKTKEWVMSLATEQTITFYGSKDLRQWSKLSSFGEGIGAHGGVWECPDLFPLQYKGMTKWVLLVSINPGGPNGGSATQYFIGNFDGKAFTADKLDYPLWVDYGRDNYAGVTWSNVPQNKFIMVGWTNNWTYANDTPTINFRGGLTLPREFKLVDNGKHLILASEPIETLKELRENSRSIEPFEVVDSYFLDKLLVENNGAYELQMTIKPRTNTSSFSIILSNREDEELVFNFDLKNNTQKVDRSKSGNVSFNDEFAANASVAPLEIHKSYDIRIFIDKNSSELFVNNGELVQTNSIYPTEAYNKFKLTVDGGSIDVENLSIHSIK